MAHLYETLVRTDCEGNSRAGLAGRWSHDAAGTTLELREGATFWDGQPVTAQAVVAAWRRNAQNHPGSVATSIAAATVVIDERRLRIELPALAIARLADPTLAVIRAGDRGAWPVGTGPYRPGLVAPGVSSAGDRATPRGGSDASRSPGSAPLVLEPVRPGAAPRLIVHVARGTRARDLVDSGVDLLLADDPELVRYAMASHAGAAVPLPWDRSYVLLGRGASPARGAALLFVAKGEQDSGSLARRAALARDVVRAEARGTDPRAWIRPDQCGASMSSGRYGATPETPGTNHVAHAAGDDVARALAERVAALSSMPMGDTATADSLSPRGWPGAPLVARAVLPYETPLTARALIVALPFGALESCDGWSRLAASAPWVLASPVDGAVVPLVDTRWQAVVRSGVAEWRMESHGALRVVGRRAGDS